MKKNLKTNLTKLVENFENKFLSKFELRDKTIKTVNFYKSYDDNIMIMEFSNKNIEKKITLKFKMYTSYRNKNSIKFDLNYKEYDMFNESIKSNSLSKFSKYQLENFIDFLTYSSMFKLK